MFEDEDDDAECLPPPPAAESPEAALRQRAGAKWSSASGADDAAEIVSVASTTSSNSSSTTSPHEAKSAFTSSSGDTLSSTSQDSSDAPPGVGAPPPPSGAGGCVASAVRAAATLAPVLGSQSSLTALVADSLGGGGAAAGGGGGRKERRYHSPRKSRRANIPAPLALAAAAANMVCDGMPIAPPPRSSLDDGAATPPDTPTGKLDSANGGCMSARAKFRGRFKIPPPLRIVKKKRSCPSLFTFNNISNVPSSPKTPDLAGSDACNWIQNRIGMPQGRADGDAGLVFRFDVAASGVAVATGGSASTGMASKSSSLYNLPKGTATSARYKLLKESPAVQICKLDHPRSVVGKLTTSKLLRRWETHVLLLDSNVLRSTTPFGFMETPVGYGHIEDVQDMPRFDGADKFCLRIFIPDGSLLLQRYMLRYRKVVSSTNRPEVLLKEIKCMVDMAKESPLQDDSVYLEPVQLVCGAVKKVFDGVLPRTLLDPLITCVAPLLETVSSVAEICPSFNRYCREQPRSRLVEDIFSNVAHQTLKKNMDFGKYPSARTFVQRFLLALMAQNNGIERVTEFVKRAHGPGSACPHPRVLPNVVSVCLAGVNVLFDGAVPASPLAAPCPHALAALALDDLPAPSTDDNPLRCFCAVFDALSEFEDWRLPLSSMLQPLPFHESAFSNDIFSRHFHQVMRRVGTDVRCEVHLAVLGVRDGKEGWFHLYCPGGPSCVDSGELFADILETLLECCCKRKRFLQSLNGMLGPLQLLALRENNAAMQALCAMLEMEVVESEDTRVQMVTALQSTAAGRRAHAQLCDRRLALGELQSKGGPRKLTLPSKSTDSDLAVLLSSGSFGNLEWLSLAFTDVTSGCADCLVKLPSLRYLNLWSTQFGDSGVQLISEHLHKLQVLNLCETPVTDKGLLNLVALKNLRKLNLNSTRLSAKTFEYLRERLPALQEVDVRYTEAWCAEDLASTRAAAANP